jgi:hypothetical protein
VPTPRPGQRLELVEGEVGEEEPQPALVPGVVATPQPEGEPPDAFDQGEAALALLLAQDLAQHRAGEAHLGAQDGIASVRGDGAHGVDR